MIARWPGHFAERACHADAYTARRTAPDSDREFAPFSSPYATAPLPALEHRTFDRPAVSHDPSNAASRDPVPERPAPSLPVLRVLGQVAGTYIIAEGPEGLYMIDQHAAHERVVYERFLGQISAAGVERQPMLDPLVFDLSPEESAVVEQSLDELGQLGFELERFGPSSLIIRSVPAVAVGTDVQARLRAILRELGEGGRELEARFGSGQRGLSHINSGRTNAQPSGDAGTGRAARTHPATAGLRPWPSDDASAHAGRAGTPVRPHLIAHTRSG